MTIENKKLELIGDILANSAFDLCDIEDVAKSITGELPIGTVLDICKTWPVCYKERNDILSGTGLMQEGMRVLAMEILLRELTDNQPKKVANG